MIKPFMNGDEVHWNDKDLQLKWVRPELPQIPMWVAGYGPKALAVAGRVGDGVIIQLADPEIIQWIMSTARAAAEEAGRDPAELKCIVCAPSHVGPIEEGREQTRWFPAMVSNHVMDLIERYGTDGSVIPTALTDYVAGAEVLRLQRALPRRRRATASSSPTRSATASPCSATSSRSRRSCASSSRSASTTTRST